MKLALFSTVENNILTNKNVTRMAITPLRTKILHRNYKCLIFNTD